MKNSKGCIIREERSCAEEYKEQQYKKKLSEGAGGDLKKAAAGKSSDSASSITEITIPFSYFVWNIFSGYFEITIFYFNPNIYPEEEYRKRVEEQ